MVMRYNNHQDTFDVRQFLRGDLEVLPPMPNPVVVTGEGKPRFKGVRHYHPWRHHSFLSSIKGGHEEEKVCFTSSKPVL